jgi:hypothetical protein
MVLWSANARKPEKLTVSVLGGAGTATPLAAPIARSVVHLTVLSR